MEGLLGLVAEADKDRYLSLLFAPASARQHLAALYAFDVELEKIKRQVSEPQLGQIRLQWWREALETAYAGGPTEHPLVAALAELRSMVPLSVYDSMLNAAGAAIFREQPETLEDLEAWTGRSTSVVIQGAALVLGGSAPDAAGLAGVAFGIARRLAHGEKWLVPTQWKPDDSAGERIVSLARHAATRLDEARKLKVDPQLLPAFLPASVTTLYLKAVSRNPTLPQPISPVRRQFAIWWSATRNRF